MTLETFFEIIESSIKRMIAPVALITSGCILAVYLFKESKMIFPIACVLAGMYVGAMFINTSKKVRKLCSNWYTSLGIILLHHTIFLCIYAGAVALAVSKVISQAAM